MVHRPTDGSVEPLKNDAHAEANGAISPQNLTRRFKGSGEHSQSNGPTVAIARIALQQRVSGAIPAVLAPSETTNSASQPELSAPSEPLLSSLEAGAAEASQQNALGLTTTTIRRYIRASFIGIEDRSLSYTRLAGIWYELVAKAKSSDVSSFNNFWQKKLVEMGEINEGGTMSKKGEKVLYLFIETFLLGQDEAHRPSFPYNNQRWHVIDTNGLLIPPYKVTCQMQSLDLTHRTISIKLYDILKVDDDFYVTRKG